MPKTEIQLYIVTNLPLAFQRSPSSFTHRMRGDTKFLIRY